MNNEVPLPLSETQERAVQLACEVQQLQAQIREIKTRIIAKAHEAMCNAVDTNVVLVRESIGALGLVDRLMLTEPQSFCEFDVDEWIELDPLRDVVQTDNDRVLSQVADVIAIAAWALHESGGFEHSNRRFFASEKALGDAVRAEMALKKSLDTSEPKDDAAFDAILAARDEADLACESQQPPSEEIRKAA